MAWARFTDTAATSEVVMAVLADPAADERSVNEVFGFVARLYLQVAQQQSDYRISLGQAALMGGARTAELIDFAARAGYLERAVDDLDRPVLKLLDDPEFIHVRTQEEIAWEKQRKADNGNPHLTLPVRVRDGDACRSCSRIVRFGTRDHRSALAGTYDHRIPGQPCRSPEDMVVLCKRCNSGRRDAEGRRDELFPLLPPPEKPYWHKQTVEWLREPEHRRVLEDMGLRAPAPLPAKTRDRRAGTELRAVEAEALRKTGIAPGQANAAAHPARSSEPAPGPERAANAAVEREEQDPVPSADDDQRPSAPMSAPEPATCATSQGTRSGSASAEDTASTSAAWIEEPNEREEEVDASARATVRGSSTTPSRSSNGNSAEFRDATSPPPAPRLTSENASCRSRQIARLQDLDIPGRDGSGRDGQGLEGPGLAGGPRPQGAPPPPPPADGGAGAGRRRRGRRGKRGKS